LGIPTCHQASQQENTYCTKYQKADRASTLLTLWFLPPSIYFESSSPVDAAAVCTYVMRKTGFWPNNILRTDLAGGQRTPRFIANSPLDLASPAAFQRDASLILLGLVSLYSAGLCPQPDVGFSSKKPLLSVCVAAYF
jgi:hypothetical protein